MKAIEKLIALGNPHYQDVKIDENFLEKESNLDDLDDTEGTQREPDPQEVPNVPEESLLNNKESMHEVES